MTEMNKACRKEGCEGAVTFKGVVWSLSNPIQEERQACDTCGAEHIWRTSADGSTNQYGLAPAKP